MDEAADTSARGRGAVPGHDLVDDDACPRGPKGVKVDLGAGRPPHFGRRWQTMCGVGADSSCEAVAVVSSGAEPSIPMSPVGGDGCRGTGHKTKDEGHQEEAAQ